MRIDSIDNFRPLKGDCLIEIDKMVNDEISFAGTKLKIVSDLKGTGGPDDAYLNSLSKDFGKHNKDGSLIAEITKARVLSQNPDLESEDHLSKQVIRCGTIAALPLKEDNDANWDYDTPIEASVGDFVYFDSYYTREQIKLAKSDNDKVIECGDKLYLLVPYRAIYYAKGKYGINGFIVGEKIENEGERNGIYYKDDSVAKVKVLYPPISYPTYKNNDLWGNTEVEVGDVVYCAPHFCIPIDSTIGSDTKLVRVACRVIMAIE